MAALLGTHESDSHIVVVGVNENLDGVVGIVAEFHIQLSPGHGGIQAHGHIGRHIGVFTAFQDGHAG